MPKKTYTVLSPLEHNGELIPVGESVDLDDKHAAPLIAVKVIEAPVEEVDADAEAAAAAKSAAKAAAAAKPAAKK